MKNNPYFQQIKSTTIKGTKTILVFSLLAMALWIILLSLWVNGVYQFDWNIFYSILLFTISAFVYLLITVLGIFILSSIFIFVKRKVPNFINGLLGLIVAFPLIKLASLIIWVAFYSNGSAYRAGELSSNPLFIIPNILTIGMLVYTGWRMNKLPILESEILTN